MITCKKIRSEQSSAVYEYCGFGADNAGEVRLFSSMDYEILKKSSNPEIDEMYLTKLMVKYRNDLSAGVFRDKMVYEI